MLSFKQARQIAEDEINRHWTIPNDSPVIVDEKTIEKPYAWIFFYTSKLWLNTADINYVIGGNAPLFITKANGQITAYGTGYSIEEMIDKYEEANKVWSLKVTSGVYTNASKLLILKAVLHLTQEKLSNFKANKELIVDKGAYRKLHKLRLALNEKQVDAEVHFGST